MLWANPGSLVITDLKFIKNRGILFAFHKHSKEPSLHWVKPDSFHKIDKPQQYNVL